MFCISVSHKTTPLNIREQFNFNQTEQDEFSSNLIRSGIVSACVILSTCNRSEIYFTGQQDCDEYVESAIAEYKKIEDIDIKKHYLVYSEMKAVEHLFKVTCGLDSMVLGEDEILHQVKEAYLFSSDKGYTDSELNIIFQGAFNCSKTIKTNTVLSKTPVSIGTLTANKVEEFLKDQSRNSTVLIVGATGKIGSIVAKNLIDKNICVVGTSRKHKSETEVILGSSDIEIIEFDKRYEYANRIDVIISATTSPHYTFTYGEYISVACNKTRKLIIDLAVPSDVDKKIGKLEYVELLDIDYIKNTSKENNHIKLGELEKAKLLLEECVEDTVKTVYIRAFKSGNQQHVEEEWFDKMIYYLRETLDSEQFGSVLKKIESVEKGVV